MYACACLAFATNIHAANFKPITDFDSRTLTDWMLVVGENLKKKFDKNRKRYLTQ